MDIKIFAKAVAYECNKILGEDYEVVLAEKDIGNNIINQGLSFRKKNSRV